MPGFIVNIKSHNCFGSALCSAMHQIEVAQSACHEIMVRDSHGGLLKPWFVFA